MTYSRKSFCIAIFLSVLLYLFFFWPSLQQEKFLYSGKDSMNLHYASSFYLYERLQNGEFPFWTERIFAGFPIYLDLERGFLNPINIFSVYVFGPILGYKIMHLLFYLLGSISMFFLFKKLEIGNKGFLVGSLVYFFNHFVLLHQQHFNLTIAVYSFPAIIYFTHLSLDNVFLLRKKFFIPYLMVATLMINLFYLGSFQMLFIIILAQLTYSIIFFYGKISFKSLAIYFIFLHSLLLILTLPVLFDLKELYFDSVRSVRTDYTEGSFFPLMLSNLAVPFLFGMPADYIGVIVHRDYLMHETYVYMGIFSLVFTFIAYFQALDPKVKRLFFIYSAFAFSLMCIKYIPIVGVMFGAFRYWPRVVFVFYFGCALVLGAFVQSVNKHKFLINKSSLRNLGYLSLFLVGIQIFAFRDPRVSAFLHLFLRNDYIVYWQHYVWVLFFFIAIFFVTLLNKSSFEYKKELVKNVLLSLLVIDTLFFGYYATVGMYKNTTVFDDFKFTDRFESVRILDSTGNFDGDNALYQKRWGLLGYSQFTPKNLYEKLTALGFKNARYQSTVEDYYMKTSGFLRKMADLGVFAIVFNNETIYTYTTFPLKWHTSQLLERTDGHLKFRAYFADATNADTYIKYNRNWKVNVDGKRTNIIKKDMFLSFPVSFGEHIVEFTYIPTTFYLWSLLTCILLIIYLRIFITFLERENAKY